MQPTYLKLSWRDELARIRKSKKERQTKIKKILERERESLGRRTIEIKGRKRLHLHSKQHALAKLGIERELDDLVENRGVANKKQVLKCLKNLWYSELEIIEGGRT